LLATTDSTVIDAIPIYLFSELSINITGISSKNIPHAYVYI
jgi:hypothetical protein